MKLVDLSNDTYHPPDISVGDDILIGKFKNRKAKVTGFSKDDHGQPELATTKGKQKLFKPRIVKLDEGRDAPLYHGTTIYQFLSIFVDNILNGYIVPDAANHVPTIRTSRDYWASLEISMDEDISGVVIQLNQTLLNNKFKLIPFADLRGPWPRSGDASESEEIVVTSKLAPLDKYMDAFYVDEESINEMIDDYPSRETGKYLHGWSLNDIQKISDEILSHPKRIPLK